MTENGKRERISKAEKIDLALRKYTFDTVKDRFPSLEELFQDATPKRAPAVISRATKEAFRNGWVRIVAVDTPEFEDVSTSLDQHYPGVRTTVIQLKERDDLTGAGSDRVHRAIGARLARDLGGFLQLLDSPTLGLGGGRGVYHVVQEMRGLDPARTNSLLVSLSGDVHARNHARTIRGHLDADLHAQLLTFALDPEVPIPPRLVHSPISWKLTKEADSARQRAFSAEAWRKKCPEMAIVGVGVLAEGHRFADIEYSDVSAPALDGIRAFLKPLLKLCGQVRKDIPGYFPVADICNRLFFVPPEKEGSLSVVQERRIRKKIKEINARLVNASMHQLAQIDRIFLVAGTRHKAQAIRHLLLRNDPRLPRIHALYTDSSAAAQLEQLAPYS